MCLCRPSLIERVPLAVAIQENYRTEQRPIIRKGRRHFIECIGVFRLGCSMWLETLPKAIPFPIAGILFSSEWEYFWKETEGTRCTPNVTILAAIFTFFEINGAPSALRRNFWQLLLERPFFDLDQTCSTTHNYCGFVTHMANVPLTDLFTMGALHDVKEGWVRAHFLKGQAFNVWSCRGFYSEDNRGHRRLVDTAFSFADDNHDPIDWNVRGLIAPETVGVKDAFDNYPHLRGSGDGDSERLSPERE